MAQALHKAHEELESKVTERKVKLSDANQLLKTEMRERELTEEALRQSEEKLRQTRKLEPIGLLARGFAHDFNNLVLVIIGYSDMTLCKMKPDNPFRVNLTR